MAIQVTRSSMPDYEEYCREIKDLWDSHWLTNMGIKHQTLERQLKDYLQVSCLTLFTNGHLALENLIASFGFPGGSEVITTPFTFVSTTHAIVRSGLKPVFCDIEPDNFTMDVSKLEALITPKTAAILPVHVYGNLCDVDKIREIADRHGVKVIYDAAHTFGVRRRAADGTLRSAADYGDGAILSFHATKVFNTIEGGAAVTHDPKQVQRLDDMKNFGIRDAEHCAYIGGNAKMSEFQAAMGICNLRHADEEIEKRSRVYGWYREGLEGISSVRLWEPQPDVVPNYAYLPVIFEGDYRNRVFEALKKHDIYARKYFYPMTSSYECYEDLHAEADTPVAAWTADHILTLPMYADLDMETVSEICSVIRGVID